MAVVIDSIKFQDEYTGVIGGYGTDTGIDFLMGCVGDKMWVKIDFHVEWNTLNTPMTISLADNTITRTDTLGSFLQDGFHIGDNITLDDAGINDGNYIIDTVTDTVITVTGGLGGGGSFGSVDIYGTTDIDFIDFYYNCIANSSQPTYGSLSDVNTQKMVNVTAIPDNGSVDLVPGTKQYAWVDIPKAAATVTGVSTYGYPSYDQYFSITVPFFIKPFYLNGQTQSLRDLLADTGLTPPEYFKDLDCLKFVYKIDARYTQRDPTVKHTSGDQTTDGNTGWFNELLDGAPLAESGILQFNLISTEYFDSVTGYPTSQIDYEEPTIVQITIQCPTDSSPINAPFVVNFCWLPNSNLPYQNKGIKDYTDDFGQPNDFRHLFLHDRAKQIEGAAAVNGDRYGTDYQVITDLEGSYYGTELIVRFTVDFGAIVKTTFEDNLYGRDYMIWVTPQAPAATS